MAAIDLHLTLSDSANRPHPNEIEFKRFPVLSFLDNIIFYFKEEKVQLKKTKETIDRKTNAVAEYFEIKTACGKVFCFSIMPYQHNYMFGWLSEGYIQERSWHFIIRDIILVYNSGFS